MRSNGEGETWESVSILWSILILLPLFYWNAVPPNAILAFFRFRLTAVLCQQTSSPPFINQRNNINTHPLLLRNNLSVLEIYDPSATKIFVMAIENASIPTRN